MAALLWAGTLASFADAPDTAPSAPPSPEPPFVESGKINANDPITLDPGTWEVQPTYFFFHSDHVYGQDGVSRPDSEQDQTIYGLAVSYGVAENFDVNAFIGNTSGNDTLAGVDPFSGENFALAGTGISDGFLGTRWRFYESPDASLSMAYLTSLTLPGSARGGPSSLSLSQDATSLDHRWVTQKVYGRLSLISDLGIVHPVGGNNVGYEGGLSADLAAGYQLNDALQPVVELNYGTTWFDNAARSDNTALTLGFTYYPIEEARLNVGLIRTIAGHNSRDGWSTQIFLTISP